MSTPDRTIVYSRNFRAGGGLWGGVAGTWRQIRQFQWQIWVHFRRDFAASYKQTGLGLFWAYALPAVPITVYVLLAELRVLPRAEDMEAAVYITVGVTLFYLYSGALQQPIQAIRNRGATAVRTEFPLIGVIVASFAQLAFDTMVRLVVVAAVLILTGTLPPLAALAAPLLMVAFLPLFFGVGLILSVANLAYKDVEKVVSVALTYLVFASAVIFPLPERFILLNPFAIAVKNTRDLLVLGHISMPLAAGVAIVSGIVALLMGARLFYMMEFHVKAHL